MRVRGRPRGAAGFTLIELLIAITILGVITIPLADLLIGYFVNVSTTTARLSESDDEQYVAAFWQKDVAAVGVRSSTFDAAAQTFPLEQSVNTPLPCALPDGATDVVVLAWDGYDASGTGGRVSVAYATDATGTRLLRVRCDGSTRTSITTLAHDLDPARPPVVTCAGSAGSSCTGAGEAVPATITLRLRVVDPSGAGDPYTVTLTGQRRQT